MTQSSNNGGGAFQGPSGVPSNVSAAPGSNAQLRNAMAKISAAGSPTQAGHLAMQGIVGASGLSGQQAQPLINELAKNLKKQAELIEGMRKHGSSTQHLGAEAAKLANIEAALQALQNQQKTAMNRTATFDPNFITNLNKIAAAFATPAFQRVAAQLGAAAASTSTASNQAPPGGAGAAAGAGANPNAPGSLGSQLRNIFGNIPPVNPPNTPPAGGAGGSGGSGGGSNTPPAPGSPMGGPNGNNALMQQFLKELQQLRMSTLEYNAKQKGSIQSNLTSDDLKNIKNGLANTMQSLMQDPSLSNDNREMALNKFNSAITRFESAYNSQSSATKNLVSFVSGVVTTLQLGQLAQKMALTDPYQYQTMPAINAIGNTGKMGGVLSAGLSAREGWELEQNQSVFGIGAGMMGAGALMRGKGGLALGLAGAGMGALGLTGGGSVLRDFIGKATGTMTSDQIMSNMTAEKLMQPQTLVDRANMSKGLYTAFGGNPFRDSYGKAGDNFTNLGNLVNGGVNQYQTKTGNAYLDKFLGMGMDGTGGVNARNLGMDADATGAFLGNIAGNLRGKTMNQSMNLSNYALKMATAYGQDPNVYAQTYQGMQSVGMTNLKEVNNESLSVFADAKGEVTQFSANVLQPALMKVTQGLAMRSVSTSAEKLSENVNAFQKYLMTDLKGTELGRRAAADPGMLGSMMDGFAGATGKFTQSTAGLFASQNILGVNPYDLIRAKNDPMMFMKTLNNSINNLGFNKDMFETVTDSKGNKSFQVKNEYGKHMEQLSELLGGDFAKMEQLVGAIVSSGKDPTKVLAQYGYDLDKNGKLVESAAGKKTGEIADTPEMKAAAQLARQSDEFTKNVLRIESKISKLQEYVLNYTSSTKFLKDAQNGINAILEKARKLLDIPNPGADPNGGRNGPPPRPAHENFDSTHAPQVLATQVGDYFKGIGFNSQSLTKLKEAYDSGDKKEMWAIIKTLEKNATAAGNTSFSKLIDRTSANDTAGTIFKVLGENFVGTVNPTPGKTNADPFKPGANSFMTGVSRIANMHDGGHKFNNDPKLWGSGAALFDLFGLRTEAGARAGLKGIEGTLSKDEQAFAQKNFGLLNIDQNITPTQQDMILDKVIAKTKQKFGKDTSSAEYKSTMALLTSVKTMNPTDSRRDDLVKLIGLSASNTNGALNLGNVLLDRDGKAISSLGAVMAEDGSIAGLDPAGIPKYAAPAKPKLGPNLPSKTSGAGKTTSSVNTQQTGADEVVITVTAEGAARKIESNLQAHLVSSGYMAGRRS